MAKRNIPGSIVWVVIGCVFALVMIKHIQNRSFHYPLFSIPDRSQAPEAPEKKIAAKTSSSTGPLRIEQTTYIDGSTSSKITIAGTMIDGPVQEVARDMNKHIDSVNEQKDEENFILIILDAIGVISAFYSAWLEFRDRTAEMA